MLAPRASCGLFSALLVLAVASAHAATSVSLVDLLHALSAAGYEVLFSSELVPADLTVPDSATSADLVQRARQALAVHHLMLKSDGQRRFVVTREPTPAAAGKIPTAPPEAAIHEVTVFASRYTLKDESDSDAASLRRDDIEQVPGTQQDVMRALRTVPGLADNLSSRPYVRGAFLDDVLVRFDGIPMVDPFHFRNFQNLISAFDPATVDRMDIYTGGFPVKFGTRSGAVIDITPRTLDSGYEHRVGANLFSYDASSAGRAEDVPVEWLATARKSTPNIVLQPRGGDIGEPAYFDVLGRLRWQMSSAAAVTAGWLLLDDQVSSSTDPSIQQAVARDRDTYSWLNLEWTPSSALHSRSSVAVTDSERRLDGSLNLPGAATGQLAERRDITTVDARSDWTYLQSTDRLWNFGLENTYERAELDFSRQESLDQELADSLQRSADASVEAHEIPRSITWGAYGSVRQRLGRWELEAGARLDHQDYRGLGAHSQLSPRLNLRFDPTDSWHLYTSWGHFRQAQRVGEWRAESSQTTPDPATHVVDLIGGVEQGASPRLHWRLEIYSNHWLTVHPYFDNELNRLTLIPELGLDRVLLSPTGGDTNGVELSANSHLGEQWSLSGSYTLSRSTDDFSGQDIRRSWDQTHALNTEVAWRGVRDSASIVFSWHSGWPQTPLQYSAATLTQPAYLSIGARNSSHWGSYLSLDLRVAHTVTLPRGELQFWADATNVFNRGNACCYAYGQVDAAGQLLPATQTSWFPRVFNIGFDYRLTPRNRPTP